MKVIKIGKLIKHIFIALAIVFLIFQPILVPVVYAVDSWSGNTWEGNTWEGNTWEGNTWEGNTWEGNTWEGNTWEGNTWEGNTWEGNTWEGNTWEGNTWEGNNSGNGQSGDPSNPGDPNNPNNPGSSESPNNPGDSLNPGDPNNPNNPGSSGSQNNPGDSLNPGDPNNPNNPGSPGLPNNPGGSLNPGDPNNPNNPGVPGSGDDSNKQSSENNGKENLFDTKPYEIGTYVAQDIIGGQTNFIEHAIDYQDQMDAGKNPKFGYRSVTGWYGGLIVNGFKLGSGENALTDTYDNASRVVDTVDAVDNIKKHNKNKKSTDVSDSKRTPSTVDSSSSNTSKTKSEIAKINDSWKGMKPLSKFNVGLAAAGTVASGIETGFTIADSVGTFKDSSASGAEKTSAGADIGEGVGNTLMNAGVVAAAIPGGQLAGGIMVAGGAGVWAISKGVNLFAKNWKGDMGSTTKEIGRKAKNGIKKGWKAVKGWFS